MSNAERCVLVFLANWCGPCLQLKTNWRAHKTRERFSTIQFDDVLDGVDSTYECLFQKYHIQILPTIVFLFQDEEVVVALRHAASSRRCPRAPFHCHSGTRSCAGPESILPVRGYRFQARAFSAPRNDAITSHTSITTLPSSTVAG